MLADAPAPVMPSRLIKPCPASNPRAQAVRPDEQARAHALAADPHLNPLRAPLFQLNLRVFENAERPVLPGCFEQAAGEGGAPHAPACARPEIAGGDRAVW